MGKQQQIIKLRFYEPLSKATVGTVAKTGQLQNIAWSFFQPVRTTPHSLSCTLLSKLKVKRKSDEAAVCICASHQTAPQLSTLQQSVAVSCFREGTSRNVCPCFAMKRVQ